MKYLAQSLDRKIDNANLTKKTQSDIITIRPYLTNSIIMEILYEKIYNTILNTFY